MTRLTCERGKTLRVVGLSALGPHNRPPPRHAARCPYLSDLRRQIASTCNGHRRCYVSSRDLRLTRRQCPGVAAVFIDVACSLRGGTGTALNFPVSCFRVSGVARNLSWSALLRLEGPKFEAEGRERDRGSWGRGSEPPPHQVGGLGSAVSPDRKCILNALRAQKTCLVAANVVSFW